MNHERLNQPGVLACMLSGGEPHYFTDSPPMALGPSMRQALSFAELSTEPVLVKLGSYSVRVVRYGDDVLAVAYWNGSGIVKSLSRMMRRAMGLHRVRRVATDAQAVVQ